MVQGIGPSAADAQVHRVDTTERPELRPRNVVSSEQRDGIHAGGLAVELAPHLRELQRAIETVKQAPDVRVERVAELRQAIASGRYSVDPAELAARLVAKLRPDLT